MGFGKVSHGGGPTSSVVIEASSTLVIAENLARKYAIIVASRDNPGPIFLKLSPQFPLEDDVAVVDQGIPLYPGDAYEMIENENLFVGSILGIKPAGATGGHTVLIQDSV